MPTVSSQVSVQQGFSRVVWRTTRLSIVPLLAIACWIVSDRPSWAEASRTVLAQLTPSQVMNQGTQVSLNGRTLSIAWRQQPAPGNPNLMRIWMADLGFLQATGAEFLNTGDSTRQPVQWFQTDVQVLPTLLSGQYRYLDITEFAKRAGWQITTEGNTLKITTESARVTGVRQGRQAWGDRVVVDLDRPTPWQATFLAASASKPKPADSPDDPTKPQQPQLRGQTWSISIEGQIDPTLLQRAFVRGNQLQSLTVTSVGNQTQIKVTIPLGWRPQILTLNNPGRIVIDIRPDWLTERDITWASGVRWRQQYRNLGSSRFPVVWLEINPRHPGVKVRPILSNSPSIQGTAPLLQTAEQSQVAAAINAGFFNRNERLALGAIRQDNRWLSGPILNRGAIAWNDAGDFRIGRLSLQEAVVTSTGQRLPLTHLNSAYIQAGIGRYTSEWGPSYIPFTDNETIIAIADNATIAQYPGGAAGKTAFPIPTNGYLLVIRSNPAIATQFPVSSSLRLESTTVPVDFNQFPYILSGGPVLVQNSQIVLDAKAEGFSDAYVRQTAIRSAVGLTASGTLIVAAVHNRAGGAGPTFGELAQIMQQMGVVAALNLDGGSSTSLYLGGQLLDRPPQTAARVHNALGIFLQP